MPKIEIPSTLRNFFKKVGIDDLPRIFRVLGSVRGVVVINVPSSPVPIFHGGKLKLISINVANVDTSATLNLRPAADKKWHVLEAWCYHNDTGAGRNLNWQFYDGTNTIARAVKSLTNGVHLPISLIDPASAIAVHTTMLTPLILTRDVYAQAKCVFLTGETYSLFIEALVLEIDV